ncbi:hypothetical protein R1sor_011486 [Riccia sorocarpa]|uniref:Alkyl transferase n=1 Tax=Riccia sorocarpa TaxID=122646 RepID=A0ABD3I104_9MARC
MEEADSKTFSPLSYFISLYSAVCGYFRHLLLRILAVGPVPQHIAIIMDGNRRYADRSHIDRTRGHLYGYDRLISTLERCSELGVKYVTVYAFSIDNFMRPADEVQALMNLMEEKLDDICNSYRLTKQYGVRVQILGELSLLPSNVRAAAERAMAATRQNSSVVLNICLAYTSTAEMVHSIQEIRDKFLATLSEAVPTGSACLCSSKSEAENRSGRTGARNGYSHGSEFCVMSSNTSLQSEACEGYSTLCSQRRQQNGENGFVHDMVAGVNFREVDGKSGQERQNGLMTEGGEDNDRFPVTGVAKEFLSCSPKG